MCVEYSVKLKVSLFEFTYVIDEKEKKMNLCCSTECLSEFRLTLFFFFSDFNQRTFFFFDQRINELSRLN